MKTVQVRYKVVVTLVRIWTFGRTEMGILDQYVFYRFGSVDCEHKTVVFGET